MSRTIPNVLMLLDNPFSSDLRVEKEATSLVVNGFDVTIIATSRYGLPVEEIRNGIRILRWLSDFYLHPISKGFQQKFQDLKSKIDLIDFDILHCHDYMMLNLGGKIKADRPEIFLTYDSHEYFAGWKYYQEIPSPLNRIKGFIVWKYLISKERKHCQIANAIVTTTSAISGKIKTGYNLQITPLVLRNIPTIKKSEKNIPKHNLRTFFSIPDDQFLFVQSGNIYQPIPLMMEMFEAVAELKNVHMVVINNRKISATLAQLVNRNETLKQVIHFVEYCSKDLANQLSSVDFGMLFMRTNIWSSHYLTSPNRIMEYCLCGLPFISIPQSESEYLSKIYDTVEFFKPENIQSFKEAIQRMIDTLSEKRKNAERIKYSLSWETEFRPVVELYKKVAARKGYNI